MGRERERPIFLGADNPSYNLKAEVETTSPGFFLFNFILYPYFIIKKKFFKGQTLI